jgi:hypothetical protein
VRSWELRHRDSSEPTGRETSAVGNRYQATDNEDLNGDTSVCVCVCVCVCVYAELFH